MAKFEDPLDWGLKLKLRSSDFPAFSASSAALYLGNDKAKVRQAFEFITGEC